MTTSGRAYNVPTAEHIGFLPLSRLILVELDFGDSVDIPALHVATIEPLRRGRRRRA